LSAVDVRIDERGDRAIGVREEHECILDRYLHRSLIHDRQHKAGMVFRGAWLRAALPCATTSAYGEQRGRGGGSTFDARITLRRILIEGKLGKESPRDEPLITTMTRERFDCVRLPVILNQRGHVALAVCGLDEWAGGTRRLDSLREGLTDLADYWGLEDD
jgi:hypothetical protein